MRGVGAAWLSLLSALVGCGEADRSLRWELDFSSAADRARAGIVEATILRGGCDGGEEIYRAVLGGAGSAMPVPELEPGAYGFAARARDGCTWFVGGCAERQLPLADGERVVTLLSRPLSEREPGCSETDGGGLDGGPRDGAVPTDGGDGGTGLDAGPPPDGGGVDAGPAPTCPLGRPTWPDTTAWDRTVHVSPSGSDGGDGSATSPVATVDRALALARSLTAAGQSVQIQLAPGTYSGLAQEEQIGSPLAPARLFAPGGATIDGAGGAAALYLQTVSYLLIEGVTLQNASRVLRIEISGAISSNVVIRNVTIRDPVAGGECIRLYQVDDVWIEDNDLLRCGTGVRILAGADGVVTGNRFQGTTASPARRGVSTEGGAANMLVHGNLFAEHAEEALRAGGNSDLGFFRPGATAEAHGSRFVANTIVRAGGSNDRGAVVFDNCDGCVIANNTIVQPRGYVVGVLNGNTATSQRGRNGIFSNNVVAFTTSDLSSFALLQDTHNQLSTFEFGPSLFWAFDDAAFGGFPVPSEVTEAAASFVANPRFVGAAAGDYHVTTTSPVRAAGRVLSRLSGLPDTDGQCYRGTPAVGADEPY